MLDKLEAIKARFDQLGIALTNPEIVGNNKRFAETSKEYRTLEKIVVAYNDYKKVLEDIEFYKEALNGDDEEMRELAKTEAPAIEEKKVEMRQIFYWTVPLLSVIKPIFRYLTRTFIEQDRDVVDKQGAGLNEDPALILINDADKPARWYYALKKELMQSRLEGREFVNPVPHTTLKWRT